MRKNSELPSWLSNDPGSQFTTVYSDLAASMANANRCGRTEWDLGGEEARSKAGQHKQRILLKRARHEFIENVKGMVERKIFEGNVVEAYNEFSKLCVFNLEKNHALHFEDPTDPTNDAEYIPSMLECCR